MDRQLMHCLPESCRQIGFVSRAEMSSKVPARNIRLKRAYEAASADDGARILIDRLWPRGMTKQAAALDRWMKEIAPSSELREWFGHDPARWQDFRGHYRKELRRHKQLLTELRSIARRRPLTLVYSARDEKHNDAVVLRNVLLGR
jgi:uncharacterized protein YeaO (DUF488 family)